MSQHSDVWAITWFDDTATMRAAASIGTATTTTLNYSVGINGCGALVSVTSSGDEDDTVFTVTGIDMAGNTVTEDITGVNAGTVIGSTYFAVVTSIANDTASVGNISYGLSGLALPKTRIRGIYFLGSGTAGSITVNRNSNSLQLYKAVSPASSGSEAYNIVIPADGILTAYAIDDYAVVTLDQITSTTIICG